MDYNEKSEPWWRCSWLTGVIVPGAGNVIAAMQAHRSLQKYIAFGFLEWAEETRRSGMEE